MVIELVNNLLRRQTNCLHIIPNIGELSKKIHSDVVECVE